MSIDNICTDFRKTGIYPFDPKAILKNFSESLATGNNSPGDDPPAEDELVSSIPENQPDEG